ncbi:MAG: ankyrin repeat domain-containing protein [Pirellulaceae bacterium]|nr:ankyrin repeat domain-containing protein [Pirellulaceae bacterium]
MTTAPNNTWTSDAIRRGDLESVKQRIVAESDYLSSRDYLGDTPLITAIGYDCLPLVEFMLDHDADPNVSVEDGYTCLILAVESDSPDSDAIVGLLIEAGADIHFAGINGGTPLHMAAMRGKIDKARRLIESGARVNQRKEIDGSETPLMEAAFMGNADMVRYLLQHGADPGMREVMMDRTPLEIAQAIAAGPDLTVYESLKSEDFSVDTAEVLADLDLPPEQARMIKDTIDNLDMAENYLENSQQLIQNGDHPTVIRILSEWERRS